MACYTDDRDRNLSHLHVYFCGCPRNLNMLVVEKGGHGVVNMGWLGMFLKCLPTLYWKCGNMF